MKKKNPHTGSSFDDFLKEEGIYEEVKAETAKRLVAMRLAQAMKKRRMSKNKMAKAMRTSRASLDRLLDPDNPSVTLFTIIKAASVLGKNVQFSLKDA